LILAGPSSGCENYLTSLSLKLHHLENYHNQEMEINFSGLPKGLNYIEYIKYLEIISIEQKLVPFSLKIALSVKCITCLKH
jgi:hypothetical protein